MIIGFLKNQKWRASSRIESRRKSVVGGCAIMFQWSMVVRRLRGADASMPKGERYAPNNGNFQMSLAQSPQLKPLAKPRPKTAPFLTTDPGSWVTFT